MRTVTYAQIQSLAFRRAGWPRNKADVSDAEDFRDLMLDNLEDVWNREAWPELCNDFESVTLTNGAFTKDVATKGDVLSVFAGNPQTGGYVVQRLDDWIEGDGVVRVTAVTTGPLFVEYQDPVPTLPAYGAAGLATTTLPARFKNPLALLCAADLSEDEDVTKADRLRARAERELIRQASRFSPPWWRR